jgi:hypothetical protein
MDASQYKDYVLFILFIKYISDKYANSDDFAPPVNIPPGASFKDMVALKGKSDIGDKINTQIIQPLINANSRLARSDFPDFPAPNKLGEGPAKFERLSNLIAIFEDPSLDFSKNRAEHDDILGDAYEYAPSEMLLSINGTVAVRIRAAKWIVVVLQHANGVYRDPEWSNGDNLPQDWIDFVAGVIERSRKTREHIEAAPHQLENA